MGKIAFGTLLLMSIAVVAWPQNPPPDLTEMKLEDLMNIEVTSASKREQKLAKVAAAIYVISEEEIRRSGATNIPDLLRMVPGLQVAQIDANAWAITSRGFNGPFANKLLVLIDGRTVYSPLFAGVFWDQQDVPLSNIEHIEVIRGPGATVWGANAVNGIINIITKSAKATQGGSVTAGTGSQSTALDLVQYGGKVRRKGYYRLFTKYSNYSKLVDSSNRPAADGWRMLHAGFRSDWDLSAQDSLTVEGDLYEIRGGQSISSFVSFLPPFQRTFDDPIRAAGGNLLGRWNRTLSSRSDMALQIYYDRTNRTEFGMAEVRDTLDLDFQHHLAIASRHDTVWGFGYRFTADDLRKGYSLSFSPARRSDSLFSAFVQDEIHLANPLWLTLGAKFEHNDYTGVEVQPSARLLWAPHDRHTVWAAVSRAIRPPSRTDADFRLDLAAFPGPNELTTLVSLFGNPKLRAEELRAYELGYRLEPHRRVSLDIATFYNIYHHLRTNEPAVPFFETTPLPPHLVIPQVFDNKMRGESYGAEVAATWNVFACWKLNTGYTWLKLNLHLDPSSHDLIDELAEGDSPQHQFQILSYLNLPHHLEFDTSLYYVDRLPNQKVPSYARLDARLGWRLAESVELSVAGQNLLDPRHFEFGPAYMLNPTQAKRSVYGRITWRF